MEPGEETAVAVARTSRAPWRAARIGGLALLAMLAIGVLVVWLSRERIADNIIADQMQQYDLPGTYDIESISPARQVVRNVVIGDPADPDLTIERVVINLRYRFGYPAIGRVELTRPRLYGSVGEDGQITFGALDKAIFAESDQPPGLPDLDILLDDGRARIDTPWGNVGLKAQGEGELDDGFTGTLAAIAPRMEYDGCTLQRLSLYGDVRVVRGRPILTGPLRAGQSQCPAQGLALARADFSLGVTGDATLDGADIRLEGKTGRIAFAGGSIEATSLGTQATLRGGRLVAKFDSTLEQAEAGGTGLASLGVTGGVRTDKGFTALQSDIALVGEGLSLDSSILQGLRDSVGSAEGTLAAPLLAQLTSAIEREVVGSSLAADFTVRSGEEGLTIVAPRASLRGRGGDVLATMTRVQLRSTGSGVPLISGNIAMGGAGLPQVQGRMERDGAGSVFRLRMAPYAAKDSRLAFSDLDIRQSRSGALTLKGSMQADGPLPGGAVRGLNVPLDGQVAANGTFTMWGGCTPVSFQQLGVYDLTLDARRLTLCPQRGRPILRFDGRGLSVVAGAAGLDLKGRLGESPIRLASGPVGIAWPGKLAMLDVDLVIGEEDNAARFLIPELRGELGEEITGTFAQADIALDAVPLDIREASGNWSYIDSVLAIDGGTFRVEDRKEEDLFNPLYARDAALTLVNGRIEASAALRENTSDRVVTFVDLAHDLGSGVGFADLRVDELRFDSRLQPVTLTELARGIVALVDGAVSGTGRIDWNARGITSTGRFRTDSLDLAAPFGPVRGASGTIVFTDLLGLTTAPDQKLFVKSINPGIEVEDGVITWQLTGGTLLEIRNGSWPWLGGTLAMRPVRLDFSQPETRRYIFDVRGLDAALFIERLELSNLSARGIFDGTVGVTFDEFGNGFIEDSVLIARPPGGNVSYVGELTYEDMGAIANFAFQSLRSLDFKQMRVGIEGPLAGEVLTAISFEGVSQGEGASKNFITKRLAKLPIRFNVNIRAPFYQLLTNMRSLYDPDYIPDPRSITGLMPRSPPTPPAPQPQPEQELAPTKPPIQDPESEDDL
ncbi:YdbH domain-containing protein [Erythrobacter sp. SDW2]|uniref:intermembrane phospholipid transport protein YdbH family protein n=1 Tax=Erythrobacter sp. SDW2 TaxID=2907154 RepID=UPI001F36D7B1|nr:YdbH domain-containing protein [Erythrobacter sp. SDW2]UIP05517.1 YdbH domain-containing protein [Erythrobacter sp. SDW2]